jgi:uncharacterized protein (TIGR02271 family)
MDTRFDQIQAGWSVYGRDGDKIGDIEEVGPNYLLVTKGLIFVTDLYVPMSAITDVDPNDGRVHLSVDKSAVGDQGWNEPPVAGESFATADSSGPVEGLGYTGRESDEGSAASVTSSYTTDTDTDYGRTGTTSSDIGDTDRVRVPVHEEELRAERVAEQAGEVRVGKNIVEEERTLDVPVSREEVEIRRVSTDRPAAAGDAFTDGDTIRVPVTAEKVNVTKEPRVVEEIEISKQAVTDTQRVSDTVRREELDVEESGNVLTGAGASVSGSSRDLDATVTHGTSQSDLDDDISRR